MNLPDGPFHKSRVQLPLTVSRNNLLEETANDLQGGRSRLEMRGLGPTDYFLERLNQEINYPISKEVREAFGLKDNGNQWTVFYYAHRPGLIALTFPPPEEVHPNKRTLEDAIGVISVEYLRKGLQTVPSDLRITTTFREVILTGHYRRVNGFFGLLSMERGISSRDILQEGVSKDILQEIGFSVRSDGRGAGYITDRMCQRTDAQYFIHLDNKKFSGPDTFDENTADLSERIANCGYRDILLEHGIEYWQNDRNFNLFFNPQLLQQLPRYINRKAPFWRNSIPIRL